MLLSLMNALWTDCDVYIVKVKTTFAGVTSSARQIDIFFFYMNKSVYIDVTLYIYINIRLPQNIFSQCNVIVAQWHLCEVFAVFAHFTCVLHIGPFMYEYVTFQCKSHCD